jgi:hypothetical protein
MWRPGLWEFDPNRAMQRSDATKIEPHAAKILVDLQAMASNRKPNEWMKKLFKPTPDNPGLTKNQDRCWPRLVSVLCSANEAARSPAASTDAFSTAGRRQQSCWGRVLLRYSAPLRWQQK